MSFSSYSATPIKELKKQPHIKAMVRAQALKLCPSIPCLGQRLPLGLLECGYLRPEVLGLGWREVFPEK